MSLPPPSRCRQDRAPRFNRKGLKRRQDFQCAPRNFGLIDQDSSIKLSTANGFVDAKGGLAKSIQLRSLQALDVSMAVQADNQGLYGANVDGLLGMSFLSRFNVIMDGKTVKVRKANAG